MLPATADIDNSLIVSHGVHGKLIHLATGDVRCTSLAAEKPHQAALDVHLAVFIGAHKTHGVGRGSDLAALNGQLALFQLKGRYCADTAQSAVLDGQAAFGGLKDSTLLVRNHLAHNEIIHRLAVQVERQGFLDDRQSGILTRFDVAPICRMVSQQLDGVAVLCRVQRRWEGEVFGAFRRAGMNHLCHGVFALDMDLSHRLHRGVLRLVNVQRIISRGRFLGDFDGNRVGAVTVVRRGGDVKVLIVPVFLDIGLQLVRAGVGCGERGSFARRYIRSLRGQRQRWVRRLRRNRAALLLAAQLFGDDAAYLICTVHKRGFLGGFTVRVGGAIEFFAAWLCGSV